MEGNIENADDLRDVLASMEPFKYHCYGVENKLIQYQKAGLEHLARNREKLFTEMSLSLAVLQKWQRELLAEMTGITTIKLTELHLMLKKVQNSKDFFQETFSSLKAELEKPSNREDLASISGNIKDKIREVASTILEMDKVVMPEWPELDLSFEDGSLHSLLAKMSHDAVGRVHMTAPLKEGILEVVRLSNGTNSCLEKEWITLSVKLSGIVTSYAIAPYLTASVTLSGKSIPCDVQCAVGTDSLDLYMQTPPSLGMANLVINVKCFRQHLKGSPVILALQGGMACSFSMTPVPVSNRYTFTLPHCELEETTKQFSQRSILCGCVCGKLPSALLHCAEQQLLASSQETCRGECMTEVLSTETDPFSVVPPTTPKPSSPVEKTPRTCLKKTSTPTTGFNFMSSTSSRVSASHTTVSSSSVTHEASNTSTPSSSHKISFGVSSGERRALDLSDISVLSSENGSKKMREEPSLNSFSASFSDLSLNKKAGDEKIESCRDPIAYDMNGGAKARRASRGRGFGNSRKVKFDASQKVDSTSPSTVEVVEGGDFIPLDPSLRPSKALPSRQNKGPVVQTETPEAMNVCSTTIPAAEKHDVLGSEDTRVTTTTSDEDSGFQDVVRDRLHGRCVQVYGSPKDSVRLKSPVGVVQLPDESVVVCDTFNNRLVHYSADASSVEAIDVSPPLNKPSAALVLPFAEDTKPEDISFAVKDHTAIHVFSSSCKRIRALGKNILGKPYGLAVNDEGFLITVETTFGTLPCITRVHPVDGKISRVSFNLVADKTKGNESKPRFISCHRNEVLIVVDLGLDIIAMVSMGDGSVLRKFGRQGTTPGLFRDPSGVVCDADGFIIIGDSRNHRIQVFSPEGEFLSVLRIDRPIKRPSGLCLTACGHLLVVNYWENNVAKYVLTV